MKTSHFATVPLTLAIALTAWLAPTPVLAGATIRQAKAKILVSKVTLTKVNGKYETKSVVACKQDLVYNVKDERLPTPPSDPNKSEPTVTCNSTIKGNPVAVIVVPITGIVPIVDDPEGFADGRKEAKYMGAALFVFDGQGKIPADQRQPTVQNYGFSYDLNQKEMGYYLQPDIIKNSSCASPNSTTCNETANLEEYFTAMVYLQD